MTDATNTNINNITIAMPGITNDAKQLPWLVRALWYCFFGFYLTGIWLAVAYVLALTVIGLPWAQKMFAATPTVLTLQRR